MAALLSVLTVACAGIALKPPVRRPNVVIVTVDSLRVDRLRLWNAEAAAATPNLDRLAARGTLFKNTWAVTPWTAPSVVSVFTGLHPPSHGVVHRDDTTPTGLPTLATLLAERGYRVGNFSFFSNLSYYRNLGFDQPQKSLAHRHATKMFRRWAVDGGPFVAWIHLIEPHLPYGSSGYQSRFVARPGSSGLERSQLRADVPVGSVEFAPGDRDHLIELYDLDVAEMDQAMGHIQETLDGLGLTDETIVVFIADHGEELLERGWVGHASTAVEAKLIPETLRIPLIMAGPGISEGAVVNDLTQHVDVLPAVLGLTGLADPRVVDGERLRFRRDGASSARRLAFFDSSAGGNLTPLERRDERWQGVTDGRCLLTVHLADGATTVAIEALDSAACSARDRSRLERQLAHWQEDQGRQRVELMADLGESHRPPAAAVAGYTEDLRVAVPATGEEVTWTASGGMISLRWPPADGACWVEYRVGRGLTEVEGAFPVDGARIDFGPFPAGFWEDLAGYNPYRWRLVCPDVKKRSPWSEFTLSPS